MRDRTWPAPASPHLKGRNAVEDSLLTSILERSAREEEQRDGENTCRERVSGEDDGHRANAKELEMGLMRDCEKDDNVNYNFV
jgi:hypothetical protein